MVVVLVFMLAFGVGPYWSWFAFPLLVVALFALTASAALLLSCLYVRYRDVAIIWRVIATALFYATPVLYPIDIISSQRYRDILALNPLTPCSPRCAR